MFSHFCDYRWHYSSVLLANWSLLYKEVTKDNLCNKTLLTIIEVFVHTLFMIIFECMCAHMLICKYNFVITWLEEFIFTCTASLRILAASTNTTMNFDNLLAFSPLTQTHLDFRNAVWYATCNNMAKPWIDFDSYDASLSWGLQWYHVNLQSFPIAHQIFWVAHRYRSY